MYIACFNVFSLSDIGLHRILARTYFKSFGFTRTRPGVTNTPERAETYANCPSRNSIEIEIESEEDSNESDASSDAEQLAKVRRVRV